MNREETIKKIQQYLQDKPVEQGYIFGSFARNDSENANDIDILLKINYSFPVSLLDFIGWQIDLEKIINKKVDLVAEDGVSKHIKPFIDRDKVMIYEKRSGR